MSADDSVNATSEPVEEEAEMLRLERQMQTLDARDPERAKVVRRYNALCSRAGVPSGDK